MLIVKVNPADAELVVAILKRAGYPIDYVLVDAPEHFEQYLRKDHLGLILCDHNLRRWTGIEAPAIVRQSAKDIPFVVVTSTLGDEAAVEYVKQGASDYVLKHRLEHLPAAGARLK